MRKTPWLAASLSIIPGVGHLYVQKVPKAIALLCISAGLAVTFFFSKVRLILILGGMIYFATAIPAMIETYMTAVKGKSFKGIDTKIYIIFMLLVTGLSAIPLVWQSDKFEKNEKIAWSIAVVVLAVLFIGSMILWGPAIEKFLQRF